MSDFEGSHGNIGVNHNGYSPVLLGFVAFFVLLIAFVGTFGNLLTAIALLVNPKLRQRPSTFFMVNLPACLVPVSAFGMPLFATACVQHIRHGRVTVPEEACVAFFAIGLILSQVHIHTICALAFNRLIAVMRPAWYKKLMRPRVVALYLLCLWIYSVALWLPLWVGGKLEFIHDEIMASVADKSTSKMKKGMHLFATYIFPILFTSICYLLMYMKVRLIRKKTRVHRKAVIAIPENNAIRQWDDHVTRTTLVIYIILISCSVPHVIIHVIQLYTKSKAAWLLLHVVFWLQFCFDPIVYVVFSRVYRRAMMDCLGKIFPKVGYFQVANEFPHSNERTDLKVNNLLNSPQSTNHLRPPVQKIEFSSEVHRDLLDPKNIANTRT